MSRKFLVPLLLSVVLALPNEASAENIFKKVSTWFSGVTQKATTPKTPVQHTDLSELTLEENLSIPELGKQVRKVRAAQSKEMRRLEKARLTDLKLIRDNEVIKATLSAANLFQPNDTVLSERADLYLRPFLSTLRIPDYYHVMLVMHSDNTGSEAYNLDMTRSRVQAVYDWLKRNGGKTECVVTYESGAFEPIAPNDTMEGRASNRRLEIYLIPGEAMIEMARRGELD